jgi:phosphatidylserine/phosphatidylglycerophosphate/cardiolipin synthase-like enzyme
MARFQMLLIAVLALACAGMFLMTRDRLTVPLPATASSSHDEIAVYFSPSGGCTEAVVEQIDHARNSIRLQAYSFTSAAIAKALVEAHKRGVDVQAVLDKSQRTERYSSATFLLNEKIPVYIDAKHAIAHNKIILIDGQTIITGSFNFTKAAEESNAENLMVLKGRSDLYAKYERNFEEHLAHSERYTGLQR